jgi:magnesium-transporting ATPase (P-type)
VITIELIKIFIATFIENDQHMTYTD